MAETEVLHLTHLRLDLQRTLQARVITDLATHGSTLHGDVWTQFDEVRTVVTTNAVLEELAVVELSHPNQQTFTLGVDHFERHPGRTALSPQVLHDQQVQVSVTFKVVFWPSRELRSFGSLVLKNTNRVAVPQVVGEERELLRHVLEDGLAFEVSQLLRIRCVLIQLVFVTGVSSSDHEVVGTRRQVRHLHQHLSLGRSRAQGVSVSRGVTDLVLVVDSVDRVSDKHTEGVDLEQVRHDALDVVALVVDERHGALKRLRFFLLEHGHVAELVEPLVARDHCRVGQNQFLQFCQIFTSQFWKLHSQLVQTFESHRRLGIVEVSFGHITSHDPKNHEVCDQRLTHVAPASDTGKGSQPRTQNHFPVLTFVVASRGDVEQATQVKDWAKAWRLFKIVI